jgi:hypothetical protein
MSPHRDARRLRQDDVRHLRGRVMNDRPPSSTRTPGCSASGPDTTRVETVAADGSRGYWILDPNYDRTGGA